MYYILCFCVLPPKKGWFVILYHIDVASGRSGELALVGWRDDLRSLDRVLTSSHALEPPEETDDHDDHSREVQSLRLFPVAYPCPGDDASDALICTNAAEAAEH